MSLKGRLTGEAPPAAKSSFSCEHYDPRPGTKRCRHYLSNGACDRPDELMCVEWLKANDQGNQAELPEKPSPEQARKDDVERDLFGNPLPPRKVDASKEKVPATEPVVEAPPPRAEPPLVHNVSDEEIASFKDLGVEVCITSEEIGEVWLVPEYTGQDRKELSVEHSATLTAICAAFPGAKVVSFDKPPPASSDE